MATHIKNEKTLVLIKPDGIQRSLTGEIIKRYERVGLKLIALKMLIPTAEMIETHYTLDSEWKEAAGKKTLSHYVEQGITPPSNNPLDIADRLLKRLTAYMTSGPIIAMVWQGAHAVAIVRKLTGGTEPLTTDVGTIRGDFVLDSYSLSDKDDRSVRNLVHASDSVEHAKREIEHWFSPQELTQYTLVQEKILYDVNLDGILE